MIIFEKFKANGISSSKYITNFENNNRTIILLEKLYIYLFKKNK